MSKRRRTETAPPAALRAHHAATVERIARELAAVAEEAPDVPQLAACSAQLATLLVQLPPPLHAAKDDGTTAAVEVLSAGEIGAVPFDALPLGVVEIVLLHCDAHSLGHMSCVSRFFGGGQRRSLVERAASSAERRALCTPALRLHEVTSCTLSLWQHESPAALDVELLRKLAGRYTEAPGWRDAAARLYRRAIKAVPYDLYTLIKCAYLLSGHKCAFS